MGVPLISVLMPVYNSGAFLKESIDSVLSQTFSDFEFIIINDGSSDNSEEIILTYKDSRIKYYKNEQNLGLISTLNKGIDLCNAKYIARMDADDICMPERLQKQYDFMESHAEVGVCGCDYIHFGKGKQIYHKSHHSHDIILGWMLFNSSMVHPALIMRKDLLSNEKPYLNPKYKHVEDYELWSRLIFKSKFHNMPEPLLKYRIHASQVSKKYRGEQIENGNLVRRALLEKVGLKFTEEELRMHCHLGSSQIITSMKDLLIIEKWFHSILEQNKTLKFISEEALNTVIGKQWYDACGITNVGPKAYFHYYKSSLSKLYAGSKAKLLSKCMVRWAK